MFPNLSKSFLMGTTISIGHMLCIAFLEAECYEGMLLETRSCKRMTEINDTFANCLETWDAASHCITTWFAKTSVPSINMLFGRFELDKEAWDFFQHRHSSDTLYLFFMPGAR